MKHPLPTLLSFVLCLSSCKSERTVYDQYGNVVEESQPGVEKDIYATMESRFDSAFSEKKNKDGVPETASSRVSRYQKDIDNAHSAGKRFSTKMFGATTQSSLRDKTFADSGKSFTGNKSFSGIKNSFYSNALQPDFLNESHGLAPQDHIVSLDGKRSSWQANKSRYDGRRFATRDSQYAGHDRSTYVQSREALHEQPSIRDHRDADKTSIEDTKRLLGRDQTAL